MLEQPPVYKYWPIAVPDDAGLVLVRFADGAPALLERTFKGPKVGKVLLWTMPLSRRPDHGGAIAGSAAAWSEFPLYGPIWLVVPGDHGSHSPLPLRARRANSSISTRERTCSCGLTPRPG